MTPQRDAEMRDFHPSQTKWEVTSYVLLELIWPSKHLLVSHVTKPASPSNRAVGTLAPQHRNRPVRSEQNNHHQMKSDIKREGLDQSRPESVPKEQGSVRVRLGFR